MNRRMLTRVSMGVLGLGLLVGSSWSIATADDTKPGEAAKPADEKKTTVEKKEGGAWLESWDAAVEASKKEKKPILADFTGSDWCHWCQQLDKEVFETKEFQDWAAKHVILLKVDFPQSKEQTAEVKKQNKELGEKYKIKGYPTILILDKAGKQIGQPLGYAEGGPSAWIKKAEKTIEKA